MKIESDFFNLATSDVDYENGNGNVQLPFESTLDLLRIAQDLGIYNKILEKLDGEKKDYVRISLNIVDDYYNTEESAADIGKKYFLTDTPVLRRRNKALKLIHDNCPDEIKEKYPYSDLTLAKPRTIHSRIKTSISRGSGIDKIIQSVNTGATVNGLRLEFGLNYEELSRRRRVLKHLNINVPHQIEGIDIASHIENEIKKPDLSLVEKQELLDKVKMSYYRHRHGENDSLVTLKECIQDAGFRYTNNQERYFEALEGKVAKGMVEGARVRNEGKSHKRRFLLRMDKMLAISIIQNDPNLSHLRIIN